MDKFDLLQVITTVIAFAAAASKLLRATVPFWAHFPPAVQRWAPGVVLVLGALPNALAGVTTWTDFGVAVMGAFALAMPGRHTNIPVPAPPETKVPHEDPPPLGPALLLVVVTALFGGQACTPEPCSANDITALVAKCRIRVETECADIPDSECPAIKECDALVDQRCGKTENPS